MTPEIPASGRTLLILGEASTRPAYVTPEISAGDRLPLVDRVASTRPAYVTPEIYQAAKYPDSLLAGFNEAGVRDAGDR